ncbi:MAG: hypothetical protein HY266_06800 [Deltaproteobacteria bacterium]|nr:hypothetical protein [Deltaproteobacteria bacterium]
MRRSCAIVLLVSIFAMNAHMICKSLCMAGYGNMNHASHTTMTEHAMPQTPKDICPITHNPHHAMPQTSIKCGCSTDDEASVGYELTLAEYVFDLRPYPYIISKIHPHEIIFFSSESIPAEGPPKILVPLENPVLKT